MLSLAPQMKILLAIEPVDFRKGIDGLSAICRQYLQTDPFSGKLFVFINRSQKALKLLAYDGQGFWLFQKRLSKGRFNGWPKKASEKSIVMDVPDLQTLLWNGNPLINKTLYWKRLSN